MAKVNSILDQRMKKPSDTTKMAAMAKQSACGNLTTFSGLFSVAELNSNEKEELENLLRQYADELVNVEQDLEHLISLTAEVKAINNQAALLHGERIKKAHKLFIRYRDGAFTAWLIATYGNRQTPYNLMQYYEFCEAMPKPLRHQIELMPRQAVYVLASREGDFDKKKLLVANYKGETKEEMWILIRQTFPLDEEDRRQQNAGKSLISGFQRLFHQLKQTPTELSPTQKNQLQALLQQIQQLIGK